MGKIHERGTGHFMDQEKDTGLGFTAGTVLFWYFLLYFGALLTAAYLAKCFDDSFLVLVAFFPMSFTFFGIDEIIAMIGGYLVYLAILIFMIKCRNKKKWVLGAFAVYVLLLVLNVYGCVMTNAEGFGIPA